MANHNRHFTIRGKENKDTGLNTTTAGSGRFANKDGTANIRKEGMGFFNRLSIYQRMLTIPLWRFIMVILIFYFAINIVFAGIYLAIGMDQLDGLKGATEWMKIKQVFYFSTQTFTTVGYGGISPKGDAANIVASIEALIGFLSFAIATGLIYGRFARPRAFLLFSENAVVAPYHGHTGLMFRLASYKDGHTLTDVTISVTVGLKVHENDKDTYKYFNLDLERSRVDSLPMNWTVVHPIDDKSPFLGLTEEDFKTADVELYVLVRGFDDLFSNIVQQRTSYTYGEVLHGRKFVPMYRESKDGMTTILELQKLNDHIKAPV